GRLHLPPRAQRIARGSGVDQPAQVALRTMFVEFDDTRTNERTVAGDRGGECVLLRFERLERGFGGFERRCTLGELGLAQLSIDLELSQFGEQCARLAREPVGLVAQFRQALLQRGGLIPGCARRCEGRDAGCRDGGDNQSEGNRSKSRAHGATLQRSRGRQYNARPSIVRGTATPKCWSTVGPVSMIRAAGAVIFRLEMKTPAVSA